MSDHETTVPSRIAALAEGTTISGVALGAGDVTRGLNGRKKWPEETLRASVASLEGAPITVLHSEQEAGEVTRAAYSDAAEAIVYEAELTDEPLAEQVRNGHLEVSIESRHGSAGEDDTGAMLVADNRFTGLSLVQRGASPSASAEDGPAPEQAFAAKLSATEIHKALAGDYKTGDRVAWDWSGGTANGRVAETIEDEGEVSRTFDDTEVTRDSDEEPVYVLDVWRDGEYAGQALKSESELEAWSDPPEAAQAAKQMDEAYLQDVPDKYVFQNPGAATGKAEEMGLDDGEIHQHGGGDDAAFMPGSSHESLMDYLREEGVLATDEPVSPETGQGEVAGGRDGTDSEPTTITTTDMADDPEGSEATNEPTTEELRARLSAKDDRIAELKQQVEQYEQEREDVARAYAEALAAEDSVFTPDDLVERFEVAELRERVEDREDATLSDVAEPDVQSGDTESETQTASLSEADREAAEEHRAALQELADSDRPLAEHERERRAAKLAEITGEDPDTILEQEA